jgi:hypothetical protein
MVCSAMRCQSLSSKNHESDLTLSLPVGMQQGVIVLSVRLCSNKSAACLAVLRSGGAADVSGGKSTGWSLPSGWNSLVNAGPSNRTLSLLAVS